MAGRTCFPIQLSTSYSGTRGAIRSRLLSVHWSSSAHAVGAMPPPERGAALQSMSPEDRAATEGAESRLASFLAMTTEERWP